MSVRPLGRISAAFAGSALLVSGLLFGSAGVAAAATSTLYVSPGGHAGAAGHSCESATYKTINAAVAAAPAGSTVVVCRGTYHEDVSVAKALRLSGRHATINATGFDNGIKITASWVTVEGFTVWGANAEGILAQGTPKQLQFGPMTVTSGTPVTHVTIRRNTVKGNDLGAFDPHTTNPECQAQGEIPGDCGEGIHLWSAAWSRVSDNVVTGNSGGILLTDEFGPTHDNVVEENYVYGNLYDCGITLPSHNLALNPQTGALLPNVAGVYRNTVRENVVVGNGTKGEGAGVLLASPAPVTAVYDNLVEENYIAGNELAGVTVHTHAPGAYANGNRIVENVIGRNNVGGDPGLSMKTTGILVAPVGTPLSITISRNFIFDDTYGIWINSFVSAPGAATNNTFFDVGTPVFHG